MPTREMVIKHIVIVKETMCPNPLVDLWKLVTCLMPDSETGNDELKQAFKD